MSVPGNIVDVINEQLLGQMKDNKKNGKGTLYWANGDKYTGDWIDDTRTGQGVFTWSNGEQYEQKYSQMPSRHLLSYSVYMIRELM